jgi:threonine/homoserine/homoserine lactone efflux protein
MIVSPASLAGLSLIALGMVCTPGPNMVYLLSRSILQGRLAGAISLAGVIVGILCYVAGTALGLTALMLAVPLAYEAVKWAGALYLLWMAWTAVRPGAKSLLTPRQDLKADRPAKLFGMGFLTALLNPKIAVFYVSLLPQFIDPARGHVLAQGLVLGTTQAAISFAVNLTIVFAAGGIATWFATRPSWLQAQRWIMGSLLAGFAVRLALDKRPV